MAGLGRELVWPGRYSITWVTFTSPVSYAFKNAFYYILFIDMGRRAWICYKVQMEVRAQISGVNSLLLPCPRDQILFISYGGKYLYPLSPKLHLFHADLEAFQQAKLTICQPAWRMP